MISVIILVAALLWVACGILAYGIQTAYSQPLFYRVRASHRFLAAYLGCIGPLGLMIAFFMGEFAYHGLQWHHETCEYILDGKITPQVRADMEAAKGHPRKVYAEVAE